MIDRRAIVAGFEDVAEQKELLRAWVESVVLSPEELTVTVTYRVPESVMVMLVPGPRFVDHHNSLALPGLVRELALPRHGRRGSPPSISGASLA